MSDKQSFFRTQSQPSPRLDETAAADVAAIPLQRKRPLKGRSLQPSFKTLIILTFITAILLAPFAFSPHYLDAIRDMGVELQPYIRGELFKQSTGFATLAFVILEMLLTVRKRGRTWPIRLKLPGSVILWKALHIFCGVGLVAVVLIHTIGATGINFNAVFLWVFFGVTLTALVGVVAETGILESTKSVFGTFPLSKKPMTKGPLIRSLRALWLLSHIFLVSIFCIMLVFHIALAYYY